MNIVLIPGDGTLAIDGQFLMGIKKEHLSWVPENVHAFHWYEDIQKGEIEFSHHPLETKPPNETITELGIFSQAVTTFHEELERRAQEEADRLAAIESSTDYWEQLRIMRDNRLFECDWTQLPDSPLTEEQKQLWFTYRQQLRDLPESIDEPKPLVLDPNHPSWPIPPS